MLPGEIYKRRDPDHDEWDEVQLGGFVIDPEDPDHVEVTFRPTAFGETEACEARCFLRLYERADGQPERAVSTLSRRLAATRDVSEVVA
jgi:hypothetical protein